MSGAYRILLMHPMDPRGNKLGGIETHVRMIQNCHPADFSVLFVGVDEFGDLPIGEISRISVGGRKIDFLPVTAIDAESINLPGKSLLRCTTFRFAAGALRHIFKIRAAVKGSPVTADLQRFEFAILPKLLGLKTIQMVHGEGSKEQKMDSLIKKLWFLHRANEWIALNLADRVLAVNPNIIERLKRILPGAARKAEVMTVSVDTKRFAPKPFDCADGVFKVVFAGRLDAFKDPPLMFRILAGVRDRLGGKFQFHYVGTTDPRRYPEFSLIEKNTVLYGYQASEEVAEIAASCHAGVLTSFFEGMPCYLLETLSVGRPFCAIRLPQYDPLVVDGVSGHLVERTDPDDVCLGRMVDAFVALRDDIFEGRIDPLRVHARVTPYSVENQMARLFAHHRALQDGQRASGARPAGNMGEVAQGR